MKNKISINDCLLLLKQDNITQNYFNKLNVYCHTYLKRISNDKLILDDINDITSISYTHWIKIESYDDSQSKPITYFTTILKNNFLLHLKRKMKLNEYSIDNIIKEDQTYGDMLTDDIIDTQQHLEDQENLNMLQSHIEQHYLILFDYTYNNLSYEQLAIKFKLPKQTISNTIRAQRLYVADFFKNYKTNTFEYRINTYRDISNYKTKKYIPIRKTYER